MWISVLSISIKRITALIFILFGATIYLFNHSQLSSGLFLGSIITIISLSIIASLKFGITRRLHRLNIEGNTYDILDNIFFTSPDKNIRILKNAKFNAITSSLFKKNSSWSYCDNIRQYLHDHHISINRALLLGGGGGTVAVELLRDKLANQVDIVELSSEMIEMARIYFIPKSLQLNIRFFNRDAEKHMGINTLLYDFIFVDIYYDRKIPDFIWKSAFIKQLKKATSKRGVLVINFGFEKNRNLSKTSRLYQKYFSHFNFVMYKNNLFGFSR